MLLLVILEWYINVFLFLLFQFLLTEFSPFIFLLTSRINQCTQPCKVVRNSFYVLEYKKQYMKMKNAFQCLEWSAESEATFHYIASSVFCSSHFDSKVDKILFPYLYDTIDEQYTI